MATSRAGSSRQAVIIATAGNQEAAQSVTPIAALAVGIAGCWVRVHVIDEDAMCHIEKGGTYKALWVVADADGTAIDMDAWNRDRSKLEGLVAKLLLGATIVIDGFHVQEQIKKR
jgi:hypothetical protein